MTKLVLILCIISIISIISAKDTEWRCITTKDDSSLSKTGSVQWFQNNCTNSADANSQPLLVVNVVKIDLTSKDVKISAGVAKDAAQPLQPVNIIAEQNPNRNFVAGINGGYFWRTDITPYWLDDVCRGKTRKEAESPANSEHPNDGISDGLIKINGELLGSNCNCWGFSRPAIINDANNNWNIDVVNRGEQGLPDIQNGLAAGPNLVSYKPDTYETYIDIPSNDDNINIHEHAANTAVGIIYNKDTNQAETMLFVTTDGSDECGRLDESCGINAPNLASLMKDHFMVHQSMSMDQGGSTTMWIKSQTSTSTNGDGVVSYSGGGARNVANGFFVEIISDTDTDADAHTA